MKGRQMRILIIDDSALWIKQGRKLLEPAGYEVTELVVTDPQRFATDTMDQGVLMALKGIDVLLIDKDFGESVTSTRLICVVKDSYPELPIIRWSGGYDRTWHMKYVGVTSIEKPTRNNEAKFVETFNEALAEQQLMLSVFAALDETAKPDEYKEKQRDQRLWQIDEIAQLAEHNAVVSSTDRRYVWGVTGREAGTTKHELGHCICDGVLTAEDIRPHLPALQRVIARLEAEGEIDERFRTCAEFIKEGNLDELELVRRCY
jgi:hypothetical protein